MKQVYILLGFTLAVSGLDPDDVMRAAAASSRRNLSIEWNLNIRRRLGNLSSKVEFSFGLPGAIDPRRTKYAFAVRSLAGQDVREKLSALGTSRSLPWVRHYVSFIWPG